MWHILINTIIIPLAIVILPACKLHIGDIFWGTEIAIKLITYIGDIFW
jgi:hypothetical protein